VEFRPQKVGGDEGAGGERGELGVCEAYFDLLLGQMGEDHPPHRGDMGRETGADGDRRGHDAARGHPGDVHDVVAVEYAQGRRLPCVLHQLLQMRLGDLGQREARQVGVAEFEDARGEPIGAAVGADVSEVGQRQQEAAGGGAGQSAGAGDFAEGEFGVVCVEGADDGKAALQGTYEMRGAGCWGHRRLQGVDSHECQQYCQPKALTSPPRAPYLSR
jgi:hypothetical protein